jgi:hypothetical protein
MICINTLYHNFITLLCYLFLKYYYTFMKHIYMLHLFNTGLHILILVIYFQSIILYFNIYLHINIYLPCTVTTKNTSKTQEKPNPS